MALEQLRAFRQGIAQDSLGPAEQIGPDRFPLLASSDLRAEHDELSRVLPILAASRRDFTASVGQGFARNRIDPLKAEKDVARFLKRVPPKDEMTRLVLAMIERSFAFSAHLAGDAAGPDPLSQVFDYGAGPAFMAILIDAGADVAALAGPIVEWFNCYRFAYYGTDPVWRAVEYAWHTYPNGKPDQLPRDLRDQLVTLRGQCADLGGYGNYGKLLLARLDEFLGAGPWQTIVPAEVWAARATDDLAAMPEGDARGAWLELLIHCGSATAARPSAKWLKAGKAYVDAVGRDAFRAALLRWFPLVDAGRTAPMVGVSWENIDERQRMHEINATVLRGLLWLSPDVAGAELCRAISRLATSAYRKVRGIGPRAPKVGNAAVYALSQIPTTDAVGQLAMLKVRVKFGTAQKEIEKAFNAAAATLGLPRDEIEELGVPTYGLDEVGLRRETFAGGEFAAELRVDGRDATLIWSRTADGKPLKSVPAKAKADHKEDLKELQGALKDITGMLPAQAERLDAMFLAQRTWPLPAWRDRYLNHPLVGTIARRLIWTFSADGSSERAGMFRDGQIVDAADRPLDLPDTTRASLWHPISRPTDEVLAWRAFLDRHRIRQPFKQAHREIYVLTDAERNTHTYSNRFAGHILRQHQFNALCATRGWKNKLRLMVDDTYPPASRELPLWCLRAEYWVEGAGEEYGTDTAESGAYLRVSTDQVRFYRTGAAENRAHAGGGGYESDAIDAGPDRVNEPLPLDRVPPLVLSEIFRDVDLFVGVGSVGNDPTWQDGGPEGRYRTYWQSFSFGALSETAQTRRAVLQTLLPRLTKLRDRWTLADRFLHIRGELRTYKIHLGSGNILMEPNDQYLCIVPDRSAATRTADSDGLFLPFEGDATLAVVLSKAFLLANDKAIKDPSITRQIAGR